MVPQSKIVALFAALVAVASAAPITAVENAQPPTLLYNHEGGLLGRESLRMVVKAVADIYRRCTNRR
jgi:hypothetical protein